MLSQQDAIVQATAYINQLKGSMEELKMRKELTMRSNGSSKSGSEHPPSLILPVIELGFWDSGLKVTMISGTDKNLTLSEAISILEEEGAEAVYASVSTVGDKVFHTIYAQVWYQRLNLLSILLGTRYRSIWGW